MAPPNPEGTVIEDGGEMEAAGRKWNTQKTTSNMNGNNNVYWMSTDLPGLIIRMEMKNENMDMTMTLEEFSDGE